MTDTETELETPTTPDLKFYSIRSISLATFIGGPILGGIVMRKNFVNMGQKLNGTLALVIGIVATIAIFAFLFSIPKEIAGKIPPPVIPGIYTAFAYLIAQRLMGKELKEHKDNGGTYYSAWRVFGIFLIIILISAIVFILGDLLATHQPIYGG